MLNDMDASLNEAHELISSLPHYLNVVETLGKYPPATQSVVGCCNSSNSSNSSSSSHSCEEDNVRVVAELTYENRILTEKNTFLHKSIENLVETSQHDSIHVQQVNDELKMALSNVKKHKSEVSSLREKLDLLQKTIKTISETRDCETMLNDMNASLRYSVEECKANEASARTELVTVLEDNIRIKQERDSTSAQLKEVKRKMLSLESQVSINEKLIMRESLQDEIKRLKNQNVLLQGQNRVMKKEIHQNKDLLKMSESHEKVVEKVLESADKMQDSLAHLIEVGSSTSNAASITSTPKSEALSKSKIKTTNVVDGERPGKMIKKRKIAVSQTVDENVVMDSPIREQSSTCPVCSSLPCGLMLTCNGCLLQFHVRCCKDQVQERNGDIVLYRCSSCQNEHT